MSNLQLMTLLQKQGNPFAIERIKTKGRIQMSIPITPPLRILIASLKIICPLFAYTKEWPIFSKICKWLRLNARVTLRTW